MLSATVSLQREHRACSRRVPTAMAARALAVRPVSTSAALRCVQAALQAAIPQLPAAAEVAAAGTCAAVAAAAVPQP